MNNKLGIDNRILRDDYFFEMSFYHSSQDCKDVVTVVNQGIDSRLTGFTKSEFNWSNNRLFCWIHPDEMEVLIRRLLELETENAEMLADNIIYVHYGKETI